MTYLTLTNTNVEVARKVEFLISKWEFNSYITSGIKILSVDPISLDGFMLSKKHQSELVIDNQILEKSNERK